MMRARREFTARVIKNAASSLLLMATTTTVAAVPLTNSIASSAIAIRPPLAAVRMSTAVTDMSKPNPVAEQKKKLRGDIKKALKAFSPAQRFQEDLAIQTNILNSPWFKSSSRLCAYISCEALREVDTSKILAEVLIHPNSEHNAQIKDIYVPRVEDKNRNMRMLKITTIQDLVANSMNILEPSPVDANGNQREDVLDATKPVDLFLLPGVAFDKYGRRLGRGGGYYDTFLNKYQEVVRENKWTQPLFVALAYSVQIMEEDIIPVTATDIPVDALVSPTGVIPISSAAFGRM